MTTQSTTNASSFISKVSIGTLIKIGSQLMKVYEIKENCFIGQAIYKGKEVSVMTFHFDTLTNPHYSSVIVEIV